MALYEFKRLEDHFIIYKSDIDQFFSYVILEYLKNFEPQINQKAFAVNIGYASAELKRKYISELKVLS